MSQELSPVAPSVSSRPTPVERRRSLLVLLVAAMVLAAAAFEHPLHAVGWTKLFFPPCLFFTTTGFRCAGCGTTRQLHELLHGNFTAAFQHNPLGLLVWPAIAFFLVRQLQVAGGSTPRALPFSVKHAFFLLLGLLAYTTARNLGGF